MKLVMRYKLVVPVLIGTMLARLTVSRNMLLPTYKKWHCYQRKNRQSSYLTEQFDKSSRIEQFMIGPAAHALADAGINPKVLAIVWKQKKRVLESLPALERNNSKIGNATFLTVAMMFLRQASAITCPPSCSNAWREWPRNNCCRSLCIQWICSCAW